MRQWFLEHKRALSQAAIVFGLLYSLVLWLTFSYDFSTFRTGELLFIVSTLATLLIAKNTFDEASAVRLRSQQHSAINPVPLQMYSELYKNSPVPYLVLDDAGIIISANTAAVRLFGVPQRRLVGGTIFDRLQSDTVDHLDFLFDKYRNHVSVSDELVQVVRKDNHEAWALLSLFSFVDESRQHSGLLTLVDITKQKRAEDAKSEFVSLASHQLRTPIAGMKWSAELLELDETDGPLPPSKKKYVDRLLLSIERMARLVDDFLRVSRFELGTFTPELQTLSLSDTFNDVMTELSPRVKQKNITVETFFDATVDKVVLDPNLLRMVVVNLYSNAVKYTRPDGTIHLGFTKRDRALAITVSDNGMGIPLTDQDQVFSKLFRASNAVRDVPNGTGLGLYIVKEAIEVLGGKITFSSTENLGTTFEIVLPLTLPQE